VHLGEVHLCKIHRQQWERILFGCSWKSYQDWLAFILSVLAKIEKPKQGKCRQHIDAKGAAA
jgi:hypothetical protein